MAQKPEPIKENGGSSDMCIDFHSQKFEKVAERKLKGQDSP